MFARRDGNERRRVRASTSQRLSQSPSWPYFEALEDRLALSTVSYTAWEPRVINANSTTPLSLTAIVTGNPTTVRVQALSGATFPLSLIASDTYQVSLPAASVLAGYQQSTGHNTFGFLDVFDGATRTTRLNLSANVRDATMPAVDVTPLSNLAQRSAHIVNLRRDALWTTGSAPVDAVGSFYALLPDNFDFLSVISQVNTTRNRNYVGVRNNTQGIGVASFDTGANWGSQLKLQGIVNYPIDSLFDLGETAASHEIGHRWANFLDHPSLALGSPHWPISDFARGIMGFSLPGSGAGGTQPFTFVEQADGSFLVQSSPLSGEFSELELYLMGLGPAADVPSGRVFLNQDQASQLHSGGILQGPIDTVTIDEIIASDGPRLPAFGNAQSAFRLATIVLSAGRLLTSEELSFFDYMAARGESRSQLPYVSGLASGMTKPFYVTTRGNGILATGITGDIALDKHSASVSEFGSTEIVIVSLTAQPTSNVVVNLDSSDTNEASATPPSLMFTPANWRTPQTVTIRGIDDEVVDGNQTTTIIFNVAASSSDDAYDAAAAQSVTVITSDNDTHPPTMDEIADRAAVPEDAPVQTIHLSGITAGGGETQALEITAASSNKDLVPNPTVNYDTAFSTGTISYQPIADRSGTTVITVTLRDAGFDGALDTADDGLLERSFTAAVFPVNDAPSFFKGENKSATDESTAQVFTEWATELATGPQAASDESGQTLSFIVENDNKALFDDQPAVDAFGTLTFRPKANVRGTAVVTVKVKDSGGTENEGLDECEAQTFEIEVTKPHPWHNALHGLDVSGVGGQPDEAVVAGDALEIINYINAFGAGKIPANATPGAPYLDTTGGLNGSGDNFVVAGDALAIINYINAFGAGLPGPAGERESTSESQLEANNLSSDLISLLALDIAEQGMGRRRPR